MIRLLHLEIHDTCEKCPYCNYEEGAYRCTNSGRTFTHKCDKQKLWHLQWTWELEIPEWCPLPEYTEGGKF